MKNKLSKKQTFLGIYGETIANILYVLFGLFLVLILGFILLFPFCISCHYDNPNYLKIYIVYLVVYILFSIIAACIRYDRLTRLPLTEEEKKQCGITSAEDCIMFLNLYTRFCGENFTLFSNNKFKEQVIEFIRSSMTEEEKITEEAFLKTGRNCYELHYEVYYGDYLFPGAIGLLPFFHIFTDDYYGKVNFDCWKISKFCQKNCEKAIKENWTWEKYVEEREKQN